MCFINGKRDNFGGEGCAVLEIISDKFCVGEIGDLELKSIFAVFVSNKKAATFAALHTSTWAEFPGRAHHGRSLSSSGSEFSL